MKTIKHITLALAMAATALGLTLSSCQKSFDPKSYAPKKPLPSFNGYNSSKEIEPDSLVAYWSFSGSLIDSVSKSTGALTLDSYGTGISGQGLQGVTNGYALCDAPQALSTLGNFTTSVWVNTPPPSNGIIGFFTFANTANFWGNIEMFFENGSDNTNGKVRIHISNNNNDYTYSVDGVPNLFNNWTNVTFSYNKLDGTCTLYVNGASVNTGNALNNNNPLTGAPAFTNLGKMVFGCVQFQTNPSQTSATGSQPWASYLTGQMDQVRVYDKVLSAAEISALYNLEKLGR
ncbi:MAG: LamG domain-containing protein [Bacteroidetes bacterium]|jgi:hypothetical protein|nr:LamG domain-containing protein [Bacteroidota bacterium]